MLPGLGFSETIVLALIALLVFQPKDLPLMMRKLGRQIGRLRAMAQEFRSNFDELARQAELDELRREVNALKNAKPFREIEEEVMRPLPPPSRYSGPDPDEDPGPPPGPPAVPPTPNPVHPPPAPASDPPPAPVEVPPISPPPPSGPEPIRAGGRV